MALTHRSTFVIVCYKNGEHKSPYLLTYLLTEIVRQLLEKGADVHRVTNTLDTALHGSVSGNKPDITDMLVKAGIAYM